VKSTFTLDTRSGSTENVSGEFKRLRLVAQFAVEEFVFLLDFVSFFFSAAMERSGMKAEAYT
jgi:hypothetical protein